MVENKIKGIKNRILQFIARNFPGASNLRVTLNRWRGVRIGSGVSIGLDTIIETAYPQFVSIGDNVGIGIRCTIIAHYLYWEHGNKPRVKEKDLISVRIEDDVHLGPGVIVLPNVTIGYGAVITAGSVVTHSIPSMTLARGNPAKPIAICGIPYSGGKTLKEFLKKLKPLKKNECSSTQGSGYQNIDLD